MYRRCLAGPYKEGTIRSQRDLFGVFFDRPVGMPEIMAGQSRSTSVSRRREQTVPRDKTKIMLATPYIGHLIRFVTKAATKNDPWSGLEDKQVTDEGILLSDLMEVKSGSEGEEEEDILFGTVEAPCCPTPVEPPEEEDMIRCQETSG